jgi:hypothetical protein
MFNVHPVPCSGVSEIIRHFRFRSRSFAGNQAFFEKLLKTLIQSLHTQ